MRINSIGSLNFKGGFNPEYKQYIDKVIDDIKTGKDEYLQQCKSEIQRENHLYGEENAKKFSLRYNMYEKDIKERKSDAARLRRFFDRTDETYKKLGIDVYIDPNTMHAGEKKYTVCQKASFRYDKSCGELAGKKVIPTKEYLILTGFPHILKPLAILQDICSPLREYQCKTNKEAGVFYDAKSKPNKTPAIKGISENNEKVVMRWLKEGENPPFFITIDRSSGKNVKLTPNTPEMKKVLEESDKILGVGLSED